jgi:hypothetical protein
MHNDPIWRSLGVGIAPQANLANGPIQTGQTKSILSGKGYESYNECTSWEEYPSTSKKGFESLEVNSMSAALSRPQPRPLQDVPVYVEKATSFVSTMAPQDILDKIVVALDSHNVDYEYQPLKNKIKGICYPNSIQCTFNVNIYQSKTGDKLVEFQRRSGCVIAFSQFFSRLVGDSFSSVHRSSSKQQKSLPPVSTSKNDPDVKLDEMTVQSLFEMIQSCNVDVQRQGLHTLFNVAIDDSNKKVLMQSPITKVSTASSASSSSSSSARIARVTVLDVLKQLLSSKDDQVVHYAVMILHAFSSSDCSEMCRQLLSHPLLDSMFDILNSSWSQSLSLRATKRTLAQTINALSKVHAKELMGFPNSNRYVETLEKLSCCSDLSMRKFCSQSLDDLLLVHSPNPSLFL